MGNTVEPTTDQEIDEMITSLEGGDASTEPEPEATPEDSEQESPQQTEDSPEQEPVEDEQVQPGEEEEEEPSKVERLEKKIEQLEQSLQEDAEEGEEVEASSETEEETEQLEVEVSFDEEEFVDEETHGEALTDPEAFNDFLKGFAEKIAARTQEQILQKFPELVDQRVQERTRAEVTMQRFWNENGDLQDEAKRQVLASKAQEVRSEDPNKPLQEVLREAASRTREELDLKQQAEEIDEEAKEEPAFAPDQGTGPTPSQEDNRDDQTKQIDQMLNAVG